MKKIIIIAAVAVAGIWLIISLFSSPEVAEVGEDGETVESSFASKFKNTVQNIIPGGEKNKLGRHENSPHVVVIENRPVKMDVEDAADRIEFLKDSKENEGYDFARWTLMSENSMYTIDEKRQLIERIKEVLPQEQVKLILKEIILIGKDQDLYDEAMGSLGQSMSKEELEGFVREVLARNPNPEAKAAVVEYAATRNIYVK